MAMTKDEMKKVVMSKRHDYTKMILGISGAVFALFVVLALLNLTNQVDWSMRALPTTDLNENGVIDKPYEIGLDTNENGIIDSGDVFDGHDSGDPWDMDGDGDRQEIDGIPDQGQSPMQRFLNFLFIGIGIMMGPYAFYSSKKQQDTKDIEKRLPDFLRDVAEAGRFGMTLADAIVVASSGRYGKLTPEIKKMAAQIEWGVTASETLRLFSERVNTPLVRRVVTIVVKASDAGGSVADVLTMVAHDTKEEQYSAAERNLQMSTYLAVIYISFAVFLVTIVILNLTFLPKIRIAGTNVAAAAEAAGIEGGVGGASLDVTAIPAIQICFFLAVMAHAIGDGIMAGVLQSGSIANGMRHSIILLFLGFLVLTVL
ncbi:MAG: type II secretion system F family protein [Candidatus Thermoplasmatota archaeon]|nr:type II secretion system F family protein [Euryarchaeota archaeon]MBU4031365.1 type II secretion system F family protein [Candidatus Thermoplasmatota archaeon]MBU4071335.1 type II secretion system F family protein [Candidatus Thermoplasmatota archaeon]MBU4143337.1 type II secretion system F family protein [Candidatus Thermoplasmatota archaeon]MBU4592358.1 type II secretion system F family protein [Candidatus Thermoplasmatota archaeon]